MITYLNGRQAMAAPLAPTATPFPPAVDLPGAQLLGVDGAVYVSMVGADGATWEWASLRNVFRPLTENLLLTVGVGGDFATLGAALEFVSRRFTAFRVGEAVMVEVRIKAGTVLREQLEFAGINMGFVRITSEDEVVLAEAPAGKTFISAGASNLPALNCKIQALSAGAGSIGIALWKGSTFTTNNPAASQSTITYPAQVKAYGVVGFETNIYVSESSAQLEYSDFNDAASIGIAVHNGAFVGLFNTNAKGCGWIGLSLRIGGQVQLYGGGVVNTMGGTFRNDFRKVIGTDTTGPTVADIHFAGGMLFAWSGGQYRGGTNIALNAFTSNGFFLISPGP